MREAIAHGEAAPAAFASWPLSEFLRRLRIRFGLKRKELAAKAGVSASLIGRAEKGADVRLSTLRKIYAAVGCRLLCVPAGALYDMDWTSAHLDNEWFDENLKTERYLARSEHLHELFRRRFIREMNENANSSPAPEMK
ncbi:MAG: helix-turn-helix domain-containing protein [Elusimicrobia bacterium]|nr:helix-turn-helix domain-containing protein [Elusimicrobiota bacterium]